MIYLDNAATTRPDADAFARAAKEAAENYYNPSANYGGGFAVRAKINVARESLLKRVADPAKFELIFTGSGTEADDQAIFGGARRGNAVASAGEHAAVERSFSELKNRGVEPRFAPVRADGSVDPDALLQLVDERTTLVSVVHVNNETGAVNDIAALAKAVKEKNPRCLFHSDGVQAFGKVPIRLTPAIDLYSVSAHKIGGLKGTGALIKRKGLAVPPLIHGGGQENGSRSGTENVLGILDFAYAAEKKFATLEADGARLRGYRERIMSFLGERAGGGIRRISPSAGSPYIHTVSAVGTRGEVLARMLFDRGVCVGTGSACSSKHRFSRVLTACGYPQAVLDGVLRISFSPQTTEQEADAAALAIYETVKAFQEKV